MHSSNKLGLQKLTRNERRAYDVAERNYLKNGCTRCGCQQAFQAVPVIHDNGGAHMCCTGCVVIGDVMIGLHFSVPHPEDIKRTGAIQ